MSSPRLRDPIAERIYSGGTGRNLFETITITMRRIIISFQRQFWVKERIAVVILIMMMGRIFWNSTQVSHIATLVRDHELESTYATSQSVWTKLRLQDEYGNDTIVVDSIVVANNNNNHYNNNTNNSVNYHTTNIIGITEREVPIHTSQHHHPTKRDDAPDSSSGGGGGGIAVFFTTFKPRKMTKLYRDYASRIIQSQLRMIQNQTMLQNATIYYTRFGDFRRPPYDFQEFCSTGGSDPSASVALVESNTSIEERHDRSPDKMKCVEIAARSEGGEIITLQAMHKYCMEHPTDRVVYMHSKGTYTMTRSNNLLREVFMKAILSDDCLSLQDPTSIHRSDDNSDTNTNTIDHHHNMRCDACSNRFQMWPSPHYAGNMFVAQCDYIRKLHPPDVYEVQKQTMFDRLLNATITSKFIAEGRYIQKTATIQKMHGKKPTLNWTADLEEDAATAAAAAETSLTNITTRAGGDLELSGDTIQFAFKRNVEYQLTRESWLGGM
jgi:hypothetical protein